MALDIGIKALDGQSDPLERDVVASLPFSNMSFLIEYFDRFTTETGIHIDPYDDAEVSGDALLSIEFCKNSVIL